MFIIILFAPIFFFANCKKETITTSVSAILTDTIFVSKPLSDKGNFILTRHLTQFYPQLNQMTFGPYPNCFTTWAEIHVFIKPKNPSKQYEITYKCTLSTTDTAKLAFGFSQYLGASHIPFTTTTQGEFTYFKIKTARLSASTDYSSFIMTVNHKDKNAVLTFHEAYIKEVE
jgi:hypothetical protein